MSKSTLPKWATISREERFFTSTLFHDMQSNYKPILSNIIQKLVLPIQTEMLDIGYEVCFFRDLTIKGLVERQRAMEKQTFDLMLTLSGEHIVIIEAKAQQGFHSEQMEMLKEAKMLMIASAIWPFKKVHLIALCSSKYRPSKNTQKYFEAFYTWTEISQLYPDNSIIYNRADSIYSDKRKPI